MILSDREIEKFYFHKERYRIKNSEYLSLYESFLQQQSWYTLESSIKSDISGIHPIRFNAYFSHDILWKLQDIIWYIGEYNKLKDVNVDVALLKNILQENKKNISDITSVVFWIDIREDIQNSRLKVWVWIWSQNYELFNSVISFFQKQNPDISFEKYVLKNTMLFGIDFWFDGSSRLKIYPCIKDYEISNCTIEKKLSHIFHKDIITLMKQSFHTNITFEKGTWKTIFHFWVRENQKAFLDILQSSEIRELVRCSQEINYFFLGIREEDLLNQSFQKINFYYS